MRLGDAQGAITFLAPFRQAVETASPGRFQAQYFKTFGEAYLRLGKEQRRSPCSNEPSQCEKPVSGICYRRLTNLP